ncbi:MAG: restriction endonuclease subunit S [Dehalococcoidia bacterium]|nr:restriction endonuclease subunit S [Dehalococcoidia bacterium]
MIEGLPPYQAYRDAGLGWLADVPEHWTQRRLKTLLRERVEKGFPDEPLLAATQTKGVVLKEDYENRTVLALKDLHLLKLVRDGDFVVSLRSFQGGIEYARVQGIISPAYTVLHPVDPATHSYIAALFKSKPFVENLSLFVTGIRQGQNIDYEALSRSEIPLPPPEEQEAIVRFLDHADRRIRRYIAAKQRLIKLLEEQKQAIIQRAVTRGLDPNVRLKPSGVEWLGDIPEHWEVKRLKYLFREVDKRTKTGEEVLLSLRMYQGLVPHEDVSTVPIPPAARIGFKQVVPGQMVMNRMRAAIGLFGVPTQAGLVSPDYAVFQPTRGVSPEFYLRLFKTQRAATEFRIESKGLGTGSSGFMRLYSDRFGIISAPYPPLQEQLALAEGISDLTLEIDHTLARLHGELALVREYRTRLIADVVTGKLDVRGVELPDLGYDEDVVDVEIEGEELDELGGEIAEEEEALAL